MAHGRVCSMERPVALKLLGRPTLTLQNCLFYHKYIVEWGKRINNNHNKKKEEEKKTFE